MSSSGFLIMISENLKKEVDLNRPDIRGNQQKMIMTSVLVLDLYQRLNYKTHNR